jgi:hypothetical protein
VKVTRTRIAVVLGPQEPTVYEDAKVSSSGPDGVPRGEKYSLWVEHEDEEQEVYLSMSVVNHMLYQSVLTLEGFVELYPSATYRLERWTVEFDR